MTDNAVVADLARDVLALATPASPLPEEIAGLIAEMKAYGEIVDDPRWPALGQTCTEAAAAIGRLAGIEQDYLRRHKDACDRWERIRELEAERDAIKAKTISECLAAAGSWHSRGYPNAEAAIRALMPSEGKPK